MNPEEIEKLQSMQSMYQGQGQQDDFSKWRLQMDDIVEEVEHNLRGEYWHSTKKEWIPLGTQIMNDEGVVSITSTLRIFLNKVAFLSNFTEDDVINITKNIHKTICIDLLFNWQKWDFNKDYKQISRKIAILGYMGIKRAMEEGERLSLRQQERIIRSYSEGGEKKSRFPSVPGFFRGGGEGQ